LADSYDPFLDSVRPDSNITQEEIADAQKRYVFLRDHAGLASGGPVQRAGCQDRPPRRPDPVQSGED